MNDDVICRMYSMTKSFTAVAVIALWEDGKIKLEDPVEKYIPAWKKMTVVGHGSQSKAGSKDKPAKRKPTIRHLITHTAGLGYGRDLGEQASSPAERMYDPALQEIDAGTMTSLREFAEFLGNCPLRSQPGTCWEYSYGFDVAAHVCEVASGLPYDKYLKKRILEPLNMKDTGFSLSGSQQTRLAGLWRKTDKKRKFRCIDPPGSKSGFSVRPTVCAGGGILGSDTKCGHGLMSSPRDALRLALMLRNKGLSVETGKRVLKADTVQYLLQNWLPMKTVTGVSHLENQMSWGPGLGFSPLGQIGVYHPRTKANCETRLGEVTMGGLACTYWALDPELDLALVWFAQYPDMDDWTPEEDLWRAARSAVLNGRSTLQTKRKMEETEASSSKKRRIAK
jgi:CubicO group peptidase (beta-lactamase class C family)